MPTGRVVTAGCGESPGPVMAPGKKWEQARWRSCPRARVQQSPPVWKGASSLQAPQASRQCVAEHMQWGDVLLD